jgi:hypothetical protein
MSDSPDRPTRSAGTRFPCAHCHAAQTFDVVRGLLRCEYCGAAREVPAGPPPPHPGERAVADGLRAAAQPVAALRSAHRCQQCGATVEADGEAIARLCAFCGTATVTPVSEHGRPLSPDSVLPFCIEKRAAAQAFSRWLHRLWLRPSELRHLAELEQLRGVYVPFWIFSAHVESQWSAESGRYYYVADDRYSVLGGAAGGDESRDAAASRDELALQGGPTIADPRRPRVRKTRWRTVHGQRSDVHRDLLVCASQGLQGALADQLRSYNLRRLVPYADGYLAGFAAESYAVELSAGHARARARMDSLQKDLCASAIDGDTYRNLHVRNRYSDETFRYALLPVWIATYRYRARLYRFVVSGQTGEVIGQAPYSRLKVAVACLLGLAALLLVLYLWDRQGEPGLHAAPAAAGCYTPSRGP